MESVFECVWSQCVSVFIESVSEWVSLWSQCVSV